MTIPLKEYHDAPGIIKNLPVKLEVRYANQDGIIYVDKGKIYFSSKNTNWSNYEIFRIRELIHVSISDIFESHRVKLIYHKNHVTQHDQIEINLNTHQKEAFMFYSYLDQYIIKVDPSKWTD